MRISQVESVSMMVMTICFTDATETVWEQPLSGLSVAVCEYKIYIHFLSKYKLFSLFEWI